MKPRTSTRVVSAVAVLVMALITLGGLWLSSSTPALADPVIVKRLIADDCETCPAVSYWGNLTCYLTSCNTSEGACNYTCYA